MAAGLFMIGMGFLAGVAVAFIAVPFLALLGRNWQSFWLLSAVLWAAIVAVVVRWPDTALGALLSVPSFAICLAIQARRLADR